MLSGLAGTFLGVIGPRAPFSWRADGEVPVIPPLSERWWLLPRFRDPAPAAPQRPADRENLDRLIRERPLCAAEAAALREKLAA